jgi:hypothetical protein
MRRGEAVGDGRGTMRITPGQTLPLRYQLRLAYPMLGSAQPLKLPF